MFSHFHLAVICPMTKLVNWRILYKTCCLAVGLSNHQEKDTRGVLCRVFAELLVKTFFFVAQHKSRVLNGILSDSYHTIVHHSVSKFSFFTLMYSIISFSDLPISTLPLTGSAVMLCSVMPTAICVLTDKH